MRRYFILFMFLVSILAQDSQIKLPIKPQTHQKLSLSLQKLVEELQFFRTPYQNKTSLYKRVALTEQYLQQVDNQVSQYNNVILGQNNMVDGQKNVIVGSYNSVTGSNNFVFVQKYAGQANGDLLIGKWRIQIQKKRLILVSSNLAVSFINQEENRKYLRFLTQNRGFSYGSSISQNTYTVFKQLDSQTVSPNNDIYSYGSTSNIAYTQNANPVSNTQPLQKPQTIASNSQYLPENPSAAASNQVYQHYPVATDSFPITSPSSPAKHQYQDNTYASGLFSHEVPLSVLQSNSYTTVGYQSAKISSQSLPTNFKPSNQPETFSLRSSLSQPSNPPTSSLSTSNGYQNNRFNTASANLGVGLGLNIGRGLLSPSINLQSPSISSNPVSSQSGNLRSQDSVSNTNSNNHISNLSTRYSRGISGTPSYFSGTQDSNSNSFGILSHPGYQNLVNLGNLRPYP